MPSLTDIPDKYRFSGEKYPFLNWLRHIPVDANHKRTLINLWSREQVIVVSAEARALVEVGRYVPEGT